MSPHRREQPTGPPTAAAAMVRERRRSFCVLEREGERWTAYLCTYAGLEGGWRGHFAFRRGGEGEVGADEVRTAVLFVENTEGDVDGRARGLGRPLVRALLESAVHARERRRGFSPDLHRWFRELLLRHGAGVVAVAGEPAEERSLAQLHSLYDSYRLDQVVHLIALVEPDDFRALVNRLLDGREIDFRARDRFQLAMGVVQELERRLPLPPFEVWLEDFLRDPEVYRVYTHALHCEGGLPQ
jgi:hypothetical protein